jgi:hypothetical protein
MSSLASTQSRFYISVNFTRRAKTLQVSAAALALFAAFLTMDMFYCFFL